MASDGTLSAPGSAAGQAAYGVLAPIPQSVLYAGAIWVFLADSIFMTMALHAGHVAALHSVVGGGALLALFLLVSSSRSASLCLSILAAALFGALMYSLCALYGFATLVAIQVGLMHYCALRIISPQMYSLRRRLGEAPLG